MIAYAGLSERRSLSTPLGLTVLVAEFHYQPCEGRRTQ
jgi:hypothetical protein